MSSIDEAIAAKTPLGADLAQGVETLSLTQEITFTSYVRVVLPLDGYVFWVKEDLLGPSALYDRGLFNHFGYNAAPRVQTRAPTLVVRGSLHVATDTRQEEQESYGANRVVFTAEKEVQDLSQVAPDQLWVGEFQGLRFAFSTRSSFYRQAGLWHYVGFAVFSDMATQLIDSPAGFDTSAVVVSNSLPAWLALNRYAPAWGVGNPSLPLFPSFLVPNNMAPPFAAVHILPDATRALASVPLLSATRSHDQLASDTVRVTLWGLRNAEAQDFVDCVLQYSADWGVLGIMNTPLVRDEKRIQSELGTLAMKKTVDFEVSYLQSRVRAAAQQYIISCTPNFYVAGQAA